MMRWLQSRPARAVSFIGCLFVLAIAFVLFRDLPLSLPPSAIPLWALVARAAPWCLLAALAAYAVFGELDWMRSLERRESPTGSRAAWWLALALIALSTLALLFAPAQLQATLGHLQSEIWWAFLLLVSFGARPTEAVGIVGIATLYQLLGAWFDPGLPSIAAPIAAGALLRLGTYFGEELYRGTPLRDAAGKLWTRVRQMKAPPSRS